MLNLDDFQTVNGTAYRKATPQAVIEVLERARQNRWAGRPQRLRVFFGDPETGLDECSEWGTVGYVGRATGSFKSVLLVHNSRSLGGDHISDQRIVKIMDTRTKRVLYEHPTYHLPKLEVDPSWGCEDYPVTVWKVSAESEHGSIRGEMARFKDTGKAQNYVDFMMGKRMRT